MKYNITIIFLIFHFLTACQSDETDYVLEAKEIPSVVDIKSFNNSKTDYVGVENCVECHQGQYKDWLGSHHDLAMKEANSKSVLGDFNNTSFVYNDITTRFYKKASKYFVNTDGADGELHEYEIKYTFGVSPLQQYLIEFKDGRKQALSIAWDSRSKKQGGQRWFHLYPDGKIDFKNLLHWTGLYQNWNHMCAECHSTNLKKNYIKQSDEFQTSWSEINVACEACHGPGSQHVEWAKKQPDGEQVKVNKGLVIALDERHGATWKINATTGSAKRSKNKVTNKEIETCARCHARRSVLSENYIHGRPLLDTHLPQFLLQGSYYPDGQIQDEVYVYGSFIQSKMYHQGVTCSDCHQPHSLKLRAEGNQLCTQCHAVNKFDTASHHYHKQTNQGIQCVECHMPERTYMVIDPRRDHSIRIPRPDLSIKQNTPNACNQCHANKSVEWAAMTVKKWYGTKENAPKYTDDALYAARTGATGAGKLLNDMAKDTNVSSIKRATALLELRRYLVPATAMTVQDGLLDIDPLIRIASLEALQAVDEKNRYQVGFKLLKDPVRAVRFTAAKMLAATSIDVLTPEQRNIFELAIDEYINSQHLHADRPQNRLNLGLFYTQRGLFNEAEIQYSQAIKLQAEYPVAYINLADLYRLQGRDSDGVLLLREGIKISVHDAGLHFALGLALVRQKNTIQAVASLKRAMELQADNARYIYTYGVALSSSGKQKQAISLLEKSNQRFPNDMNILQALIAFHREQGNKVDAERYIIKFNKLMNAEK